MNLCKLIIVSTYSEQIGSICELQPATQPVTSSSRLAYERHTDRPVYATVYNFIHIVALHRTKLPLSYLLPFLILLSISSCCCYTSVVLMAHWHPNGRKSEAAYFPPFEPRSSPSPICLPVKGAYIYMTSTRVGDFFTPFPVRLQNLYSVCA